MKKHIAIGFLAVFLTFGICFSTFAQTGTSHWDDPPDMAKMQQAVIDFSESIAKSLGFNSSLGLNWSDSYIGNIYPSSTPHFGVGGTFSVSTLSFSMIETLAGYLNFAVPDYLSFMPLPSYTAEGRIGGFVLPFDIGFKFGYLPELNTWGTDIKMDYLLIGGDVRYAVLNEERYPKVSVGAGVNYLKGSIGLNTADQLITFIDELKTNTQDAMRALEVQDPYIALKWSAISMDFKVQVSKKFSLATPFLGLGASYTWSNSGYSVTSQDKLIMNDYDEETNYASNPEVINQTDMDYIDDYLERHGLSGINMSEYGLSSMADYEALGIRVYGGVGLNFQKIVVDISGAFNFRDQNWGVTIGVRYQQ